MNLKTPRCQELQIVCVLCLEHSEQSKPESGTRPGADISSWILKIRHQKYIHFKGAFKKTRGANCFIFQPKIRSFGAKCLNICHPKKNRAFGEVFWIWMDYTANSVRFIKVWTRTIWLTLCLLALHITSCLLLIWEFG